MTQPDTYTSDGERPDETTILELHRQLADVHRELLDTQARLFRAHQQIEEWRAKYYAIRRDALAVVMTAEDALKVPADKRAVVRREERRAGIALKRRPEEVAV